MFLNIFDWKKLSLECFECSRMFLNVFEWKKLALECFECSRMFLNVFEWKKLAMECFEYSRMFLNRKSRLSNFIQFPIQNFPSKRCKSNVAIRRLFSIMQRNKSFWASKRRQKMDNSEVARADHHIHFLAIIANPYYGFDDNLSTI